MRLPLSPAVAPACLSRRALTPWRIRLTCNTPTAASMPAEPLRRRDRLPANARLAALDARYTAASFPYRFPASALKLECSLRGSRFSPDARCRFFGWVRTGCAGLRYFLLVDSHSIAGLPAAREGDSHEAATCRPRRSAPMGACTGADRDGVCGPPVLVMEIGAGDDDPERLAVYHGLPMGTRKIRAPEAWDVNTGQRRDYGRGRR